MVNLHLPTADRLAVDVHPRVNIESAGRVKIRSAPAALQEDEKLLLWYDQALTRTEANA